MKLLVNSKPERMSKSNQSALSTFMHVFLCYFCAFLSFLFSFFPLVTENDEKTCFHTETNDFDQQRAYRAPFAGQNTQHNISNKICFFLVNKNRNVDVIG